tara:strand:+ start:6406 stop:7737 length:1332 start_codon:yes stop_codon:yes gene_type:complete
MKTIKILTLLILVSVGFNSCQDDDKFEFIAQTPQETIQFVNSFQDEYILTSQTAKNLAERFVWVAPDFDVETIVNYEIQGSITETFDDFTVLSTTTENEIGITINQMLNLAAEAGLDNDPTTEEPNIGVLYFRIKASVGTQGENASFSPIQALNVNIPEIVESGAGFALTTWGIVGSGYNDWGAYADSPFYTTSDSDVLVAYATLFDGEIKFRDDNAWALNYGDTGVDGILDEGGDNIAVTAGTYKITFNTNTLAYSIEPFSWGIVGSGYNDWGATPDAKFYYDYSTDTFKVGVKLIDGEIKFRFNNDWGVNLGDTGADGTLEDGGDNIISTAGFYTITLDLNNNEYTITESDIWGIVGSGYNDWGATPDFSLTEVNPGVWIGDIVTIIDGEIKFRLNEDWGFNYGDTGADGTIDDGGDNIIVTAGSYRIMLDLNNGTYSLNK